MYIWTAFEKITMSLEFIYSTNKVAKVNVTSCVLSPAAEAGRDPRFVPDAAQLTDPIKYPNNEHLRSRAFA